MRSAPLRPCGSPALVIAHAVDQADLYVFGPDGWVRLTGLELIDHFRAIWGADGRVTGSLNWVAADSPQGSDPPRKDDS